MKLSAAVLIDKNRKWRNTDSGMPFRMAAAGNFCDLKRNLVKLKTLSTGVRIFKDLSERNVSFH